ncbi:uncharacterized protein GGS25DRAFT_522374 [Hypoxylon fragiforme]|uniref:uncharacterized protein n=1 Tax=Hypoxylon fragiforme TaxID=63214 RepID=UPI0020C70021|nr:uncharacterized protein GGS25DRAFT_522374 [Hypoxylon fragiforme]KAI2606855.1 hypothetical protein GGS25DRAFT_522374 [Hypoxylon fragiforme]
MQPLDRGFERKKFGTKARVEALLLSQLCILGIAGNPITPIYAANVSESVLRNAIKARMRLQIVRLPIRIGYCT